MEKHCEKCVKENIGCKEIQHLFRDVDKLKASKKFNTFLYIFITVISVGLVITSIVVWYNMLKQPIATASLKPEELKNVADLFNSQFSNLLTVLGILLTIFGVANPIVNAIYQKQTLKDERESLRREIDVSLANIEAKERELEQRMESATEDLAKQISNIKAHFQSLLNKSHRDIQEKQQILDTKIEAFEKQRFIDNGFFCAQLASAAQDSSACYYYSLAIFYYSHYATSDKSIENKLRYLMDALVQTLSERDWLALTLDKTLIVENLTKAQDQLKNHSTYYQKLQSIIDSIDQYIAHKKGNSVKHYNESNRKK